MPTVNRGDTVELSWRIKGEGPMVVICDNLFSTPKALSGLDADLSADHAVLRAGDAEGDLGACEIRRQLFPCGDTAT